jgi:4-hydroxyphenylacetate 3-monooxygenase
MNKLIFVFIGAGTGGLARYWVGTQSLRLLAMRGPFGSSTGTFIVNVLGGLLMGMLAGWLAHRGGASQEKMRLLLGLCSRIANATGADQVPAVREKLGEMAAVEATIGGLVNGQINAFENWPDGYVCFNRRYMYAGLEWCTQNYSRFIDELRTLCGGSVFQMPADISVLDDPQLAKEFDTYWQTPQADSITRMKLFKLAWDMTGSEFAGRHLQYEKFYAGASFIIRNHSYRETDWAEFNTLIDKVMAGYDVPDKGKRVAAE